jgi:hypothetical protein
MCTKLLIICLYVCFFFIVCSPINGKVTKCASMGSCCGICQLVCPLFVTAIAVDALPFNIQNSQRDNLQISLFFARLISSFAFLLLHAGTSLIYLPWTAPASVTAASTLDIPFEGRGRVMKRKSLSD